MKPLLALALVLSANLAYADYFGCRISVGGQRAQAEAEYRVLDVTVSLAGYTCAGKLRNHLTTIVISDSAGTLVSSAQFGTSALAEYQDGVSCACGLN